MISLSELAETEYTAVADPAKTRSFAFGQFTQDARFPERRDPNQAFDIRCSADEVLLLLQALDTLYKGTNLSFQKISFHDPKTVAAIKPKLERMGWSLQRNWMMLHVKPSLRRVNPSVVVKVVSPQSGALNQIAEHPEVDSSDRAFRLAQEDRLGGELIVGYLNGQPVARTGWFAVNGVVRYRGVLTFPDARMQAVASTMIQYVQNHDLVKKERGLSIFVGDDGPVKLYEELGFEKQGEFWEALRLF